MIVEVVITLLLLLIVVTDFLFYEIRNQHLFFLLIAKCFYICFYGVISEALVGIILCIFGILYLLFIKGLIGGGDVKLIMILMLGLSIDEVCNFFISMSFIGGVEVAIFVLLPKYILKIRNACYKIIDYILISKILCSVNQKLTIPMVNSYLKTEIPYGIAISFGFLLSRF